MTACAHGCSAPEEIAHLPVVGEALAAARMSSLDVPPPRLRHETIRRVINVMVTDLIAETRRRLAKLDPRDADAVRRAKQKVVAFSPPMAEANQVIKDFLSARMYRHWRVNRMTTKARVLTASCSACCTPTPSCCRTTGARGPARRARSARRHVVGDYIAGMTDRSRWTSIGG